MDFLLKMALVLVVIITTPIWWTYFQVKNLWEKFRG